MKKEDFDEGLSFALDIAKGSILKSYSTSLLRGGVVQRAYSTDAETGDMIAVVLSVLTVPKEEAATWRIDNGLPILSVEDIKKRAGTKAKGDKS